MELGLSTADSHFSRSSFRSRVRLLLARTYGISRLSLLSSCLCNPTRGNWPTHFVQRQKSQPDFCLSHIPFRHTPTGHLGQSV